MTSATRSSHAGRSRPRARPHQRRIPGRGPACRFGELGQFGVDRAEAGVGAVVVGVPRGRWSAPVGAPRRLVPSGRSSLRLLRTSSVNVVICSTVERSISRPLRRTGRRIRGAEALLGDFEAVLRPVQLLLSRGEGQFGLVNAGRRSGGGCRRSAPSRVPPGGEALDPVWGVVDGETGVRQPADASSTLRSAVRWSAKTPP